MPEVGELVSNALRHFSGERYELHAWVVMPNHVHAVLTPLNKHALSDMLHSWKSYTAHQAPLVCRASGLRIQTGVAFWQRESYDHFVRDRDDLARVCDYTVQNPVAAGLCEFAEDWPFSSVYGTRP